MKNYDVVILGGGISGLTLSIQLKRKNPDINILMLERRKDVAPDSAFKIGESISELASHYFREVLGLKDYLVEHQLPKYGQRFFFKSNTKDVIESRIELGPRKWLYSPSHQLDRGTLENYLVGLVQSQYGTEYLLDATVKEVDFGKESSVVSFTHQGKDMQAGARWVVDATSRHSFLKRKLNFAKTLDHPINSVWWRLKGVVDVSEWSDSDAWKNYPEIKLRHLSTNHFLDTGYWIWIIPLGTKNTSIGIVADPSFHPFEKFDTYEKAMDWLKENEPLLYSKLEPLSANKLDFKISKHFAHHSSRLYDGEMRWGVTGEAGVFLDPFYSPGCDLIALNNAWLSDLILREVNGENVQFRAEIYEQTHLSLFDAWVPIYHDKYQLMGSSQIMVTKILWDWAVYWSIPCLLYTNSALTDLAVIKQLFANSQGLGSKFKMIHEQMQKLFIAWGKYDNNRIFERKFIDPLDLSYLLDFQTNVSTQYGDKLVERATHNMEILEKVAAEIFRRVSHFAKGTSLDMAVNPYTMDLDNPVPAHSDDLNIPRDEQIIRDIDNIWFYGKEQTA